MRDRPAAAPGDVLLGGQALAWSSNAWPGEIDVGIDLSLPTGDSDVVGGSTAVRPFVTRD